MVAFVAVAVVTWSWRLSSTPTPKPTLIQASPFAPFSLDHPNPTGKKISLASATGVLGAPVVLPDLPLANANNVGTVWGETRNLDDGGTTAQVDVVFPQQEVDVAYRTPVPYPDPADNYKGYVSEGAPGDAAVLDLNGTPALFIRQNSGETKAGPGSIEFVADGEMIVVIGWQSQAVLVSVATSIQKRTAAA